MCARRSPAPLRPRWRLLYALALVQLGALALVETIPMPGIAATTARLGIVLVAFAAIAWWIRGQRARFDLEPWCACAPVTLTVRVVQSHQPHREHDPEPALFSSQF